MSRKKLFPGCILHAAQKNCLALKECDEDMYPNLYLLLKICCTIPATSCECERSASALRRLHTFNRASMTQERLSSLALMHIHYLTDIDLDIVLDLFAKIGRYKTQVTGHRLQVTGHRLQVTGYRSQVTGHRKFNEKSSTLR